MVEGWLSDAVRAVAQHGLKLDAPDPHRATAKPTTEHFKNGGLTDARSTANDRGVAARSDEPLDLLELSIPPEHLRRAVTVCHLSSTSGYIRWFHWITPAPLQSL
jgi:hypothetical protein